MAPLLAPPTKTGKLSDVARHVVLPDGIVSTGWPAVRETCARLGIGFDLWQDGTGRAILAKRADGLYAADIVVISIPRQVGKTFLLGWIIFALCIIHPKLTVIWTAHRFKTARETFTSLRAMANTPAMLAHIEGVTSGAGNEEIVFSNGSRIMFGARERGFGRGFSGVDVLVFDEAQILTENAMDDMVPATNQAPNPLILLTGTPPKPSDPSDVFLNARREALSGESGGVYVEFSADEGADPLDRAQWRKANPSYPSRTSERAILRLYKNLGRESFVREALGVWDSDARIAAIDPEAWDACADHDSQVTGMPHIAVDVSPARWTAVAIAGKRDDDLTHVEVPFWRSGTDWVPEVVKGIVDRWGVPSVQIDPSGPAGSLVPALEAVGVRVETLTRQEMTQGCGMFHDAVTQRAMRHLDDEYLNVTAAGAAKRPAGDAWVWSRKDSAMGGAPLIAATMALRAAMTNVGSANVW